MVTGQSVFSNSYVLIAAGLALVAWVSHLKQEPGYEAYLV